MISPIYISLYCTGLFIVMNGENMLLVPVANFLTSKLPQWICKPLYECIVCMASFWSISYWFLFVREDWHLLIPFMFIVAGINGIISAILKPLFDEEE